MDRSPDLWDFGLTQVLKMQAKHLSFTAPETWPPATRVVPACRMIGYG